MNSLDHSPDSRSLITRDFFPQIKQSESIFTQPFKNSPVKGRDPASQNRANTSASQRSRGNRPLAYANLSIIIANYTTIYQITMQRKIAAARRQRPHTHRHRRYYSLVHTVVPGFHIPHRAFAVSQPRRRRVHNHPDQPQERQHLVHQLQHMVLRDGKKDRPPVLDGRTVPVYNGFFC